MMQQSEEFAIRIVKVDHYMASPVRGLDEVYSEFKNKALTKVPVIRIFGITSEGEKACAHLHGVFPYLCIPYEGQQLSFITETFLYELANALERALSASVASNGDVLQFIYKIELVNGIPFYGFHKEERQFLKIYFLNPWSIEKTVELLQSGTIMNRSFQPHEAHIPYFLQVCIDYNLYGMNFAKFNKVSFRSDDNCSSDMSWLNDKSANSTEKLRKQTICKIEVDVTASSIINKLDLSDGELNPGISAIWEDAKARRRCMMESSQLTPVSSQERPLIFPTRSEQQYLEQINQKLAAVDVTCHAYGMSDVGIENQSDKIEDESEIIASPNYAVSTVGLSQISLNEEDLELCNILHLLDNDIPDHDLNEERRDFDKCVDDVQLETEDEHAMSQLIEIEEIAEDEFSLKDMQIPQVDGPVGSPKSNNKGFRTSLTKMLNRFREHTHESADNDEVVSNRSIKENVVNEIDCNVDTMENNEKIPVVDIDGTDSDEVTYVEKETNITSIRKTIKEVDRPPSVVFLSEIRRSVHKGSKRRVLKTIIVNDVKVKVSTAIVGKKELGQLGHEKLILKRLTNGDCLIKSEPIVEVIDISPSSCDTIEIIYEESAKENDVKETIQTEAQIIPNLNQEEELLSDSEKTLSSFEIQVDEHLIETCAPIIDLEYRCNDNVCYNLVSDGEINTTSETINCAADDVQIESCPKEPSVSENSRYPLIVLRKLDENTLNKWLRIKAKPKARRNMKRTLSEPVKRRSQSSKITRSATINYTPFSGSVKRQFTNGCHWNSSAFVGPNEQLKEKMQEIVDNQKRLPLDSNISEVIEPKADLALKYLFEEEEQNSSLHVNVDAMWNLSYPSPIMADPVTKNEPHSPVNCVSPTGVDEIIDSDRMLSSAVEGIVGDNWSRSKVTSVLPMQANSIKKLPLKRRANKLTSTRNQRRKSPKSLIAFLEEIEKPLPPVASLSVTNHDEASDKEANLKINSGQQTHISEGVSSRNPKVSRVRKKPIKYLDFEEDIEDSETLDDITSENQSGLQQKIKPVSKSTRANTQQKRPPRSRHKKATPAVDEGETAVKFLQQEMAFETRVLVDGNEVHFTGSSTISDVDSEIVSANSIAANETVVNDSCDPLSQAILNEDDEEECWIRLLGLTNSKKNDVKALVNDKKSKAKKVNKVQVGPKRPRGRPKRNCALQPATILTETISSSEGRPDNEAHAINNWVAGDFCTVVNTPGPNALQPLQGSYESCSEVLKSNGPSVIVEPNNSAIYSDNLISIYDDEGTNIFRVCTSDEWRNSDLYSVGSDANAEDVNKFQPYNAFISCPSPDHQKTDYLVAEDSDKNSNDLMSDIEKMVNEMATEHSGDVEMADSVSLALCGPSSGEPFIFESKCIDMEKEDNSGEATKSFLNLASAEYSDSHKRTWAASDIPVIDCSQRLQADENVTDLTPNVHSFYVYDSFASCDWVNDALIGATCTNSVINEDSLLQRPALSNLAVCSVYTPNLDPPSPSSVVESLHIHGLPNCLPIEVYCSDPKDVPEKSVVLGGGAVVLKLKCSSAFQEAHGEFSNTGLNHWMRVLKVAHENGHYCPPNCVRTSKDAEPLLYYGLTLEPSLCPPTPKAVQKWLTSHSSKTETLDKADSQQQHADSDNDVNQCLLGISQNRSSSLTSLSPILPSSQKSIILLNDSPTPVTSPLPTIFESTPLSCARRIKTETVIESELADNDKPKSFFGSITLHRKRLNLESATTSLQTTATMGAIQFPALDCLQSKQAVSQLDGPTPKNKFGFKISEDSVANGNSINHHCQHLTVMSVELHADSVKSLSPNPKVNEIRAIFYHIQKDSNPSEENVLTGIFYTIVAEPQNLEFLVTDNVKVDSFLTELELISAFIHLVYEYDPDILLGYEIEMHSWGFLMERASVLGIELWSAISRVPDDRANFFRAAGPNGEFSLKIVGRIILAVGSLMKSELALYIYTFENVAYHVLHKRVPLYTFSTLRDWFDRSIDRWRTTQHYLVRTKGNLQLLESLNVIGRTSELARLFGIQFEEVLNRGTQFRVESMMLRLCRSLKYVAVSPNVQQRASMRAPECLPLIMEPRSKLFTDPVVVLDFQSLYPSIIIAYNYCFSTCLGRVSNFGEDGYFPFGCTSLKCPPTLLKTLKNNITVSPCGVAFVKSSVRKGVLPKMLEEILAARVMVKLEMKKRKKDQILHRILDARQLGLKLIANVTYGYTSANFSGRMPCVEIADSVVSKSRETLERAIQLVESTHQWGAKVVYGDTDSLFVLLEGRTKQQAFEIGQEIVKAVNADNPKPVKLKLEKVYLPCVLETKKRYVGFMYETPEATEPVYDAKGIETVRRDGCPAVAKILERSLKILFKTKDVSQVKSYVQSQFHKLVVGRCGLNEYIFTREYRGRYGYNAVNHAPALKIATEMERNDSRSEPRIGERVPYVVVYGKPGDILINLVRHPRHILMDSSLRLNAQYYIKNVICPALSRALSLVGVDVQQWYATLSKTTRVQMHSDLRSQAGTTTISHYFRSTNCSVCDAISQSGICTNCSKDPQKVFVVLKDRVREWERRYQHITKICHGCAGTPETKLSCISLDCPILYRLSQVTRDACQAEYLENLMESLY